MSALPSVIHANRAWAWAWWLVPAVVLGALVGWETDWGRQVVRLPSAPPPIEPKPVAPAVLPEYAIEGGLAANGETVSRTLFNATRRPAPVLAAEGGPRTLKAGQFQLVGTTVTGERNIAFLKEVAGGKSRTVRQGEEINGMRVASVTADKVQLTLGDESEELILKVAPGPKTTLAAAPPPPAAAPAGAHVPAAAAGRVAPARVQAAPATAVQAQPQPQPQPQQPQNKAGRRAARAAAAHGTGGAEQGK
jgi:hypothetical protein